MIRTVLDHIWPGDKLDVCEFTDEFVTSSYDKIYLYPGLIEGELTNRVIIQHIGIQNFRYASHHGATLLLKHHYSCSYSGITLPKEIITHSLMVMPYAILCALSTYPVLDKTEVMSATGNFILKIDEKIICAVAQTEYTDLRTIMPVIPVNQGIPANFKICDFFVDGHLPLDRLQSLGNTYWELQYYRLWESFYDTVH